MCLINLAGKCPSDRWTARHLIAFKDVACIAFAKETASMKSKISPPPIPCLSKPWEPELQNYVWAVCLLQFFCVCSKKAFLGQRTCAKACLLTSSLLLNQWGCHCREGPTSIPKEICVVLSYLNTWLMKRDSLNSSGQISLTTHD